MEAIYIDKTNLTPLIKLDSEKGIFEISGKSFPEDVLVFFNPIRNWISEYCKKPNPKTEFVFNLEYFNSATARIVIKILLSLEEIMNTKREIIVYWHYKKDDEVMKERGEEIKSVVLLPFELVED